MKAKDEANTQRITKGQKKKHVSQMTPEEIAFIKKVVFRSLNEHKNKLVVSTHLIDKMIDYRSDFDHRIALTTLEHLEHTLIEYSHKSKNNGVNIYKRRITVRSQIPQEVELDGKLTSCNMVFVLDMDECVVISSWFNKETYHHNNINWSRYNKNLKIISNNHLRGKRGSKNRNKKNACFRKRG